MSEVSPDDLKRVHDRIDALNDGLNSLVVQVTRIATHLENYTQPCQWFSGLEKKLAAHLEDSKIEKGVWHDAAVKAGIDLVKMALVGLIVYWITTH